MVLVGLLAGITGGAALLTALVVSAWPAGRAASRPVARRRD
jgi:hypothetical protein